MNKMRARRKKQSMAIPMVLLLLSLTLSVNSEDRHLVEFSNRIRQFQETQRNLSLKFPKHLLEVNAQKKGGEFEIAEYFKIFTHLKVKENYVLDWVYLYGELGGYPMLYPRRKEQPPFLQYRWYIDAIRIKANLAEVKKIDADYSNQILKLPQTKGFEDPFGYPSAGDGTAEMRRELERKRDAALAKFPRREYWKWWRDFVIPDGSDQGFLELAALYLSAEQFHLYWHSLYSETRIIPDRKSLENLLGSRIEILDILLPEEVKMAAVKLDPNPRIEHKSDSVTISFLTFSKWSGFERTSMNISKSYPHKLIKSEQQTEVKFQCGIIF